MTEAKNESKRVIPVIGITGSGKSNLINALIRQYEEDKERLSVSSSSDSVTQIKEMGLWEDVYIDLKDKRFHLLDSAGFLDTKDDNVLSKLAIKTIDTTSTVHGFIVVYKDRFLTDHIEQFKLYLHTFFDKIPWKSIAFVKTAVPKTERTSTTYQQSERLYLNEKFGMLLDGVNLHLVNFDRDNFSNWDDQIDNVLSYLEPILGIETEISTMGSFLLLVIKKFGLAVAKTIWSSLRWKLAEIKNNWDEFSSWINSETMKKILNEYIWRDIALPLIESGLEILIKQIMK